jgi:hypothetical protein
MKYVVETGSADMMYILSFIKIGRRSSAVIATAHTNSGIHYGFIQCGTGKRESLK